MKKKKKHMPKRAHMLKKAYDEKSTFQKENIPKLKESMSKRGHVEKSKCQKKKHIPKRSTCQKEHIPKRVHFGKTAILLLIQCAVLHLVHTVPSEGRLA